MDTATTLPEVTAAANASNVEERARAIVMLCTDMAPALVALVGAGKARGMLSAIVNATDALVGAAAGAAQQEHLKQFTPRIVVPPSH